MTPYPFGRIISPTEIEQWVIDYSEKWFLEYLAEIERQRGLPARHYPALRSFVRANDFDYWSEDQLPALVVFNVGLAGPPTKREHRYDAAWAFGAAIVVSANTRELTRNAMNDYGAAFRTMLLQNQSIERSEVRGIDWTDENPAPFRDEDDRTIGAQQMFFDIEVAGVMQTDGTTPQAEPRPDPYIDPTQPTGVIIDTAEATIEQKE